MDYGVCEFLAAFVILIASVLCDKDGIVYPEGTKTYFTYNKLSPKALFGFSIAYLEGRIDNSTFRKRLLISAPKWKEETNSFLTGAVFTCDLSNTNKNECKKISGGPSMGRVAKLSYDGYWLGATVRAGSSIAMTCAPRELKGVKIDKTEQRAPYGRCYYLEPLSDKLVQANSIPEKAYKKNIAEQYTDDEIKRMFRLSSYNQNDIVQTFRDGRVSNTELVANSLGWSMEITNDAEDIILVGGGAMSVGRVSYYDQGPSNDPTLIFVDNRNKFKAHDGIVRFNFGYSIASNGSRDYAISSPYGQKGIGKVLLFNSKFEYITAFADEQVGTLFGAALCSLGSAWLVGSPLWAVPKKPADSDEVGAVHVYVNINNKMERTRTLTESVSDSYFGAVIITIGDQTGDNIDDVAIGAPYEDEGRGAVYIYSGATILKTKEEIKYLQRIVGEKVNQNLGASLTSLKDYDENGCNELAIGMPGDNKVALLRCLAHVTVHLSATFSDLKHQHGEEFYDVNVCLDVEVPDIKMEIATKISLKASISSNVDVVTKLTDVDLQKRLKKNCQILKLLLKKDADYDLPITVDIKANPSDPLKKYDHNQVVLSEVSVVSVRAEQWAIGSNLSVDISTTLVDNYIIGSSTNETVTVKLGNQGNIAHHACTRTTIVGARVSKLTAGCKTFGSETICSPLKPLKKGDEMKSTITLIADYMTSASKMFQVITKVLNVCDDPKGKSYEKKITRLLQSDTNIILEGISSPEILNVTKVSLQYENHIDHFYTINNLGITNWEQVLCNISLPNYVTVTIDLSESCTVSGNKAHCNFQKLAKKSSTTMRITMSVDSGVYISDFADKKITTSFDMEYGGNKKSLKVHTVIKLLEATVPLWVIIVAVIVGLLLVFIMLWVLRELGCCRRKNKEKLVRLERDIKRQTLVRLRQSMVIYSEGEHPDDGTKNEAFDDSTTDRLIDDEVETKKKTRKIICGNEEVTKELNSALTNRNMKKHSEQKEVEAEIHH